MKNWVAEGIASDVNDFNCIACSPNPTTNSETTNQVFQKKLTNQIVFKEKTKTNE